MPDRLDDLLHQMPLEEMSDDLSHRIQIRLEAVRSRQRRVQLVGDGLMAILAIGGILALAPALAGAAAWLSGGSVEGSLVWIDRFGRGPAPVVWETLTSAMDWARGLSSRFGIVGLLGLILLSVPLFAWSRRLMPAHVLGSDAGGEWSGAMLEEGAGA